MHINANNAEAVIADLRKGADANTVETTEAVPSFGQMLHKVFQHLPAKSQRDIAALTLEPT